MKWSCQVIHCHDKQTFLVVQCLLDDEKIPFNARSWANERVIYTTITEHKLAENLRICSFIANYIRPYHNITWGMEYVSEDTVAFLWATQEQERQSHG